MTTISDDKFLNIHQQEDIDSFIQANSMQTAGGFLCKADGKFFKTLSSLRVHVEDGHIRAGVRYQCPRCRSTFKSKNSIRVHVSTKHPELKGLDFEQCIVPDYESY